MSIYHCERCGREMREADAHFYLTCGKKCMREPVREFNGYHRVAATLGHSLDNFNNAMKEREFIMKRQQGDDE